MEQSNVNEGLKEENESLQYQQRALIRLLQEKDQQLNRNGGGHRAASCERFAQRFAREVEVDEIDERHVMLRRLVIKKMQGLSEWVKCWKLQTKIDIMVEDIDTEK